MIKVIHVFALLDRGGAETFAMNLLRNCPKDIHMDFLVHSDKHMDYENEVLSLKSKIFRLPKYKFTNHFHYLNELDQFLVNNKYDVAHFHFRSTASIMIPIFKKHGIKVIVHSHSSSNGKAIIPKIGKSILQFPLRYQADLKVGCTVESIKWLFGKKIYNDNKYKILPNAVDVETFLNGLPGDDLELLNNEFVIGHIGRFEMVKNHVFIVEIFNEYLKVNPNAYLVLVGDGPLKSQIEDLVSELGINKNVLFLGKRSDIPYILKKINVLLFPSIYEGLPVTLVETQAANVPILMSNTISKESIITPIAVQLGLSEKIETWVKELTNVSNLRLTGEEINTLINGEFNIKNLSNNYKKIIYELLGLESDVTS